MPPRPPSRPPEPRPHPRPRSPYPAPEFPGQTMVIGVPTNRPAPWHFICSLYALMEDLKRHGMKCDLNVRMSASIPENRQQIFDHAITHHADWLLFLDDDMVFPADAARALLAHKLPAVAANYLKKRADVMRWTAHDENGRMIESHIATEPLTPAAWCGMGLMLLRMDAVKTLPFPLFSMDGKTDGSRHYDGEDMRFCRLLSESHTPVMIDNELSRRVGHVGEFVYSADSMARRAMDASLPADQKEKVS